VLLRFRRKANRRNFISGFDRKEMSMAEPVAGCGNQDRETRIASCASWQHDEASGAVRDFDAQMKFVLNTLGDSAAHLQDGTQRRECLPPPEVHGNRICCVQASRAFFTAIRTS
jgi:hypothetical protein